MRHQAGQGRLQAVDGTCSGLKGAVEVVVGGVVGGALGRQPPLLALVPPVGPVGAGQNELVAVAAVGVKGEAPPSMRSPP